MQAIIHARGSIVATLRKFITHWNKVADRWDRVYLCSAAPLSAELMRDHEEAQLYHHS